MEQREIDYIGERLYRESMKDKKSGKWTKKDLRLEKELYKELKALNPKFDFYWHMQLSPTCFTTNDKGVIPIFVKYMNKFDDVGLVDVCAYCLGVRGFYDATEPLLKLRQRYVEANIRGNRNTIGSSLWRIRDPRYVKEYLEIAKDFDNLYVEDWHIIRLLGKLKAREAIPTLIRLLDFVLPDDRCYPNNNYALATQALRALSCYKDKRLLNLFIEYLNTTKYNEISNEAAHDVAAKAIVKLGGVVEKIKLPKRKHMYKYCGLKDS